MTDTVLAGRPDNLQSNLYRLRLRWSGVAVLCALFLSGGYAALLIAWQADYALRWLALTALVLVYLLWTLWRGLPYNHCAAESRIFPTLGLGNALTLLRGALIAALAGFLLSPHPEGWLAWVPGALYTLAVAIDILDGYIARLTGRATRLGELLDLSLDGVGVLVAGLIAVQYGQVPGWYLLVAFARYLFLTGIWLLKRLGKKVHRLPPNSLRRPLAGMQMGFLAAALWPLFSPPGLHIAASLIALPFLAGFAKDWLCVSGVISWSEA